MVSTSTKAGIDRCGKCKYAVVKKYGTNVHCRLTGNGQKGISSKACERFERRADNVNETQP